MKANHFFIALAAISLTMMGCKGNESKNFNYSADTTLAELSGEEARAYEFVDLGCTIQREDATYRIFWATANVADDYEKFNNPADLGGHYAWAENSEKDAYNWKTYKYIKTATNLSAFKKYPWDDSQSKPKPTDGLVVLQLKDDAANYNWDFVRTPAMDSWQWLIDNCSWEWTELNGVTGYAVTGKTGKSIFLPAAGVKSGENHVNKGSIGCYMSRDLADPVVVSGSNQYTQAKCISFNPTQRIQGAQYRFMGMSVRAVYEQKLVEE